MRASRLLASLPRALAAALIGAIVGPACLILAYLWHPEVAFEMDRAMPSFASGFYPVERAKDETFVWTAERAELTLAGLDRRVPWNCVVRFRGARPPNLPQPQLGIAVDGRLVTTLDATNDFQDASIAIPETPGRPGLVLSLTSSTTFKPGGADPRHLGVQIDRLSCGPATAFVLPPRRAMGAAALSTAVFSGAVALIGVTAGSAVIATMVIGVGQTVPLLAVSAVYSRYPSTLVNLAAWLCLLMVVAVTLIESLRGETLRHTARFVVAFAAGALYLQLAALLHPAKTLVDALFHAHRFNDVLAGKFYFTQLSTSATPFPYAIGLYLFAAPWALLTRDHVAILRIVVSSMEILAAALLYLMIVRTWSDRLSGAVAVALFSLAPVSYIIVGNANLTNAFGQAVSVMAVTAVGILGERLRRPWAFALVVMIAALGLISHVSTLLLLSATFGCLVVLWALVGQAEGRRNAIWLAGAFVAAMALAIVVYWGHFGDVYAAQWQKMRAPVTAARSTPIATPGTASEASAAAAPAPLGDRMSGAARQTVENIGWPVLFLAAIGVWRFVAERSRDRVTIVLASWAVVWIVFVLFSVSWSSDRKYQQDAWEFIGRVEHATLPVAAVAAARGAMWAWRRGPLWRAVSCVALLWAVEVGVSAWLSWLG
jgi:hypothetical protein